MNAQSALTLPELRRRLSGTMAGPAAAERVAFGAPTLDMALGGGLMRGSLHEAYACAAADLPAMTGFAVGLAMRAAGDKPILWVRQDFLDIETGRLHAPGLAELGLDPSRLMVVKASDAGAVLKAGAEATRCSSLGAVLMAAWGEAKAIDLTASRRLLLAAEASGVMTLMLRAGASPAPSAARTRWLVRALPSRALAANAPGAPAFALTLLRHRGGVAEREWRMEWDRDQKSFHDQAAGTAPLSRLVAPLPADRPAAAATLHDGFRRAG